AWAMAGAWAQAGRRRRGRVPWAARAEEDAPTFGAALVRRTRCPWRYTQGPPGIRRMEPPERGRQEVGAGSGASADREGARPKPPHLARRLLSGAQQREGLARVWLYHARRRSRACALPVTLDESDAKVRFESTQVLGDGGLADVAGLGGAAHAAMVQDGEKQLEAVHR